MKNISKIVFLMLLLPLFTFCSDDESNPFVKGDISELKIKVADAFDLLNGATDIEYEKQSIDEFKEKLDLIDKVITTEEVSEQEVVNLMVNLDQAQMRFLNSKLSQIPYENLIAGWNFDEVGTDLVGDGSRKLVASLKSGPSQIFPTTNVPQFKTDGKNQVLHFSNGSHLEIEQYNPSDFLGKQLSICVWLKPDVSKGGNYVASLNYWENWKLQVQDQGKPFFTIKTASGVADADNESDLSVKVGEWTLLVVSLDLNENSLTFYINGVERVKTWTSKEKPAITGSQASAYQSPLGKTLPLMIGAATTYEQALNQFTWGGWDTPSSWDYFQGSMDEFRFYNIGLTSGQVRWLYNSEKEAFGKK